MAEQYFAGYPMEEMLFEGHRAAVVHPTIRREEGLWAIYTEYFGAFPAVAQALLAEDVVLLRLDNDSRWGKDEDADRRTRFLKQVRPQYGLSEKGILIGMSCGGLNAVKFAALHPECVRVLYLDAPVMNFLSCPLGCDGADRDESTVAEFLRDLGIAESEVAAYKDQPLASLSQVVRKGIPAALLYGTADSTVPYASNGIWVEKAYREHLVPLLVQCKERCGHHPHGPDNMQHMKELVDFLLGK